jgi:hypothetical protein
MSSEYLHLCHASKRELIILNLNFEKVFDKVEHEAMLLVMQQIGFGSLWLQWMRAIFNSE